MSCIKRTMNFFWLLRKRILWNVQYYRVLNKYKNDIVLSVLNLSSDVDKIYVIVPHADDELIGCYNMIMKYKEKVTLIFMDLTGSNLCAVNKSNREDEFKCFCTLNNIDYMFYDQYYSEVVQKLKNEKSIYFFPTIFDWHPEHRMVSCLFKDVLLTGNEELYIGYYSVSTPICDFYKKLVVPYEKVNRRKKWRDFKRFYLSQKHMPIQRYIIEEKLMCQLYNYKCCEIYSVLTVAEWASDLEIVSKLEQSDIFVELKESIDDIYAKYMVCNKLVEKVEGEKNNEKCGYDNIP